MDTVSEIKSRYNLMLRKHSDNLSQGKMLLMGFNGLFDKLNIEFGDLVNSLTNLDIPSSWRKLDQVSSQTNLIQLTTNIMIYMSRLSRREL